MELTLDEAAIVLNLIKQLSFKVEDAEIIKPIYDKLKAVAVVTLEESKADGPV